MPLRIGIVGLPNVGKSTLFNALTNAAVPAANFPFCTIEPNVGCVAVPDERLEPLARVSHSAKVVPTAIEFVDIAGLVAGAHAGEGLGNKFLAHIREVDAIAQVVRVFGGEVTHVAGRVDPADDVATIGVELAMADLVSVRKRLDKTEGKARSGDKDGVAELAVLREWETHLNAGNAVRSLPLTAYGIQLLQELQLLTAKPLLYVLNVDEKEQLAIADEEWQGRYAFLQLQQFVTLCAKLEAELAELSAEDAAAMRTELGVRERGLDRLIRTAYETLGLVTFLTSGEIETRAWTTLRGSAAPQAAGVIHTDFIKTFIRAEVADWRDFVACNGWAGVKQAGKMRLEGKEYEIRDGDVVFFRVGA